MTTKSFFAATLFLISASALSAQASTPLHVANADSAGVAEMVDVLGQNALTVLLGMVLLMGVVWFFCIWNACAGLNKKQKNAPVSALFPWLCVAAGLSMFSSSCTTAQLMQAADIQSARTAERGTCVCHAPFDNRNYYGNTGLNNLAPYNNYSNHTSSPYCRQCGLRIYYRNR